jgi:mRNA interferase RelE/StbE
MAWHIWHIKITAEAQKDFDRLDREIRGQVLAGIVKVSGAPMPSPHGYGKPLGHRNGTNLTGFFKIKYKNSGIRVVYTLFPENMVMNIVVISERDDGYCYALTAALHEKYGDEILKDIFENFKAK